jgi:intracellular sulfur oxidation DsrE/DsrF family protein
MSLDMSHPRRSFLARFAAGLAAVTAAPQAAAMSLDDTLRLQGQDPDAWLAKLNGRYRQYFDATTTNDGFPLVYAFTWARTMRETYKLGARDAQAVIGFRHSGIGPALNDQMWAKYKIGEFFKLNDPKTGKPSVRNYLNKSTAGDIMIPEADVSTMLGNGHLVVVCNVALSVLSGMAAKAAGLSMTPEDAYKEWLANLIPGVMPVPSGVLAVHRAQEKGKCTYCNAS